MTLVTSESELARTVARDWLRNYMEAFAPSIRKERATARASSAAFVDALAGVAALAIAGRHGSEVEVIEATITSLRNAISRDLTHLGSHVHPAQTSN